MCVQVMFNSILRNNFHKYDGKGSIKHNIFNVMRVMILEYYAKSKNVYKEFKCIMKCF